MIEYSGKLAFLRWHGSVAPYALCWAIPATLLVFLYRQAKDNLPGFPKTVESTDGERLAYGLFTSILAFLIVFRAKLAYTRYWEGITLVERASAVWLNGISNIIAFCNSTAEKQVEVAAFQHLLSRLMSVLMRESLIDISRLDPTHFPTLNLDGIDPASLHYLNNTDAKQKVVLQWIQRLVVEQERTKVVDIQAPILSRVFQEFSLGIVHMIDARKLTLVPFPFQFAQMVWLMLSLFSGVMVPMACAWYVEEWKAYPLAFFIVFAFMAIHYISVEIEQPFGDDPNDLPLSRILEEFNQSLKTLLEPEAQQTPILVKGTEEIRHHVLVCREIAKERGSRLEMMQYGSASSQPESVDVISAGTWGVSGIFKVNVPRPRLSRAGDLFKAFRGQEDQGPGRLPRSPSSAARSRNGVSVSTDMSSEVASMATQSVDFDERCSRRPTSPMPAPRTQAAATTPAVLSSVLSLGSTEVEKEVSISRDPRRRPSPPRMIHLPRHFEPTPMAPHMSSLTESPGGQQNSAGGVDIANDGAAVPAYTSKYAEEAVAAAGSGLYPPPVAI